MSVLTEDNRFELALQQEERSVSNMCEALDVIEKKGIEQGRLEQLQELVNDGLLSVEVAASKLNISVEEFLHTMDD